MIQSLYFYSVTVRISVQAALNLGMIVINAV